MSTGDCVGEIFSRPWPDPPSSGPWAGPVTRTLAYLLTCMLAYLHTCILAHLYACVPAHLHTCSLLCFHTCTLAYLLTCMLWYLHTCILANLFTCSLVCLHTCTLTYLLTGSLSYLLTYILGLDGIWVGWSIKHLMVLKRTRRAQPAHCNLILSISRGFEKRTFEKPAQAPAITSPLV